MDVKIPYKPYWYQRDFEQSMLTKNRAVLCWARRHGKDYACWNFLVLQAFLKKGVYYYIFPEYSQARKAFWDAITEDGMSYLDFIPDQLVKRKLNHEMKIHLINGSIIQVLGSDNYDAIRGTNPSGVVLSEYAYQNPNVWKLILDPILSKNKGWAVFNSTPQGKNHFYDLFNYAKENESEYFVSKITNDQTNFITKEAIDKKVKEGISEEFLQQEYYCSFDIGVEGSYYGKLMRDMKNDGRICNVGYDRNLLVYTVWDLGFTDSMSIIFFQKRGNEILIIDFYENTGYELAHYLEVLRSKEYNYGRHFAPHDAKAHDRTGNTFVQIARGQGFNFSVLPQQGTVLEGIEKVRGTLPRVYIDKDKCDYLIRCLLDYHADYDENSQVYKNIPKHSWSSHAADATRYLIYSLDNLSSGSMTKERLSELKRDFEY
jgi:phage terminase large subunit